MSPSYMLYAIPFFFLLMGIEWLYGYLKKKNLYRLNDTIANLAVGIGSQVIGLVFKAMLLGIFIWVADNFAFFKIPATWWSFLLCLILFDFLFYWAHRWGHEVNIFWGAHLVHHQSEEYNLSVALRQSWFHNVLAFPIFLPIPLLGFEPITFGIAAVVHTLYQFWIHTQTIGKLHPWVEFWVNTPSHHRVHHSIDPKYIDKNHAGVFMIWDRLFGTFKEEESAEEIHYGITTQLKSWNPAWANVHYYAEMRDKIKSMRLLDKLRMIIAKPGWLPTYLGGTQPVREVNESSFKKYDMGSSLSFKIYAVIQFLLLLWGGVQYMTYYKSIDSFYRFVFLALMLVTMLIISGLFENKRWIVYAEYVRLVLVVISLNTYYYARYFDSFYLMLAVSAIIFTVCVTFFTYSQYVSFKRANPVPAGS